MIEPVTFRDPAIESAYRQAGYVVTPLLDADEIAHLRVGYQALVPSGDHGLTIDYMRADRTVMRGITALVGPVWARHFPALFADHRPVFTTFVVKHPGETSTMGIHEDGTFVDERAFRAGALWVPLTDVGPGLDNGGLAIIPHSHRLTEAWAGPAGPRLFRPYDDYLHEQLEPIAVPAGHALYYDSRTLHASPANRSSLRREAIVCAVAPRSADLIHVVATSRRHRRVHRVDESFFVEVHPHAVEEDLGPRYPVIDEFDDDTRLDPDAVIACLGGGELPDPQAMPDRLPDVPPGARVARRRLPLLTQDPPFTAADLAARYGQQPIDPRIETIDGTVGIIALTTEHAPAWATDWQVATTGASVAAVVAVDPDSRARVHLGPTTAPAAWNLDVIDVAAGVADLQIGDRSIPLDERWRFQVDAAVGQVVLTNHGPGILALLLTRAPVAADPPRSRRVDGLGAPVHRRLARRLRAALAG